MTKVMIDVDQAMLNTITKALDGIWYKTKPAINKASNAAGKLIQQMIDADADEMYLLKGKTSSADQKAKSGTIGDLGKILIWSQEGENDLYEADVSPKAPTPWTDAESWVSAQVKADSSGGHVKKYGNHKAFIARMSNGHVGVFVRKMGSNKDIEQVQTLSYPAMASQAYEKDPEKYQMIFWEQMDKQIKKVMDLVNG